MIISEEVIGKSAIPDEWFGIILGAKQFVMVESVVLLTVSVGFTAIVVTAILSAPFPTEFTALSLILRVVPLVSPVIVIGELV